jgi:hypothetical protein
MTPRLIAILKGGLGNQLFIYAAARALALRTGRELVLDHRSGYQHDNYGRSYRLDRFRVPASLIDPAELPWRDLRDRRHKWRRHWNKLLPATWRDYVAERRRGDPRQLLQFASRRAQVYLNGYWQREEYFADQRELIRRELTPPPPTLPAVTALGAALAETDSVFLHVRRVRYQPLLPVTYYQAAIGAICEQVKTPTFYLFGDALEWAQRELDFHGHPTQPVTLAGDDELADLWLMTQCRHAIIANSSFSWWGAWLRQSPAHGLVVAPQHTGLPLVPALDWLLR